jgi:glycine/D-amino acid oxidase-like deaminating enzyme
MKVKSILVIGGGISGLAAAYYAQKKPRRLARSSD